MVRLFQLTDCFKSHCPGGRIRHPDSRLHLQHCQLVIHPVIDGIRNRRGIAVIIFVSVPVQLCGQCLHFFPCILCHLSHLLFHDAEGHNQKFFCVLFIAAVYTADIIFKFPERCLLPPEHITLSVIGKRYGTVRLIRYNAVKSLGIHNCDLTFLSGKLRQCVIISKQTPFFKVFFN